MRRVMNGAISERVQDNGEHRVPKHLSAVLFDLDDTLLDSSAARINTLQSELQNAGIRHLTAEELFRNTRGGQLSKVLTELEEREGRELNLLDRYQHAYFRKSIGLVHLYPGVESMLNALHARGIKLGIVTQKVRSLQVERRPAGASQELTEMGVVDLFSIIVGFEDVTNYKPHPEGVELALRQLGVAPQGTLVVGDSAADIGAAKAAGCWSCHATWGILAADEPLDDFGADMVAETPEAILRLFS